MSIIGGLMGLIIFLLSKVKRLPRFSVYILWLLPLIRLWIPFGYANQYSLLNLISKFTTKTVVIWQHAPEFSATNSIQAARSYFPIEYKTDLLKNIFDVASLVWVIIAVILIMISILLYILTISESRSAILIKDNIYKSNKISAPAVYGIFKPKIIIQEALSDSDIDYIIMHENVHIRRKDNFWRVVAIITVCIHWFNPLVWLFLKSCLANMELACDAKVMKTLNQKQKKEYASSLLSIGAGKMFFASAFGGAKTKVRIENILSYKKLTVLSTLAFGLLVIAITVVLITNAIG